MKIHDLRAAAGSHPRPPRVGRGTGGQGWQDRRPRHEGPGGPRHGPRRLRGRPAPLQQRIPKLKGFKNPFRVEYAVVNLDTLVEVDGRDEVTPERLRAAGLVHKHGLVKVLGRGELTRAVRVRAHAFSASAEQAITGAGGTVEVLPPPFGHGRPPAKGNALTNR